MGTTTTPYPFLSDIDTAGETLRRLRHTAKRDDRFRDETLAADLTAAIDALMRGRLAIQQYERARDAA